jgi:hypothetical protein
MYMVAPAIKQRPNQWIFECVCFCCFFFNVKCVLMSKLRMNMNCKDLNKQWKFKYWLISSFLLNFIPSGLLSLSLYFSLSVGTWLCVCMCVCVCVIIIGCFCSWDNRSDNFCCQGNCFETSAVFHDLLCLCVCVCVCVCSCVTVCVCACVTVCVRVL